MPNIPVLTKVTANPATSPNSSSRNDRSSSAPGSVKKTTSDNRSSAAQDFIKQAGRWLVDVPVSILSEHSAWTSSGNWQGIFDCAIWLRTPAGLSHPVQLVLKYIDNSGEKILQIDRCQPGSHRTVLLNGSITLTVNGRVRDMGLYLLGANNLSLVLEEWHMTPQQRRTR